MVKTEDGVAFQIKHEYLSNLSDCQIEEAKLRESDNVYDMIKIGKRIKVTEAWKKEELRIVAKAAVLKFSQNPLLLEKLKKTEGFLYEATK